MLRADAVALLEGLLAHIRAEKTRFGLLQNQHQKVVDELSGVLGFRLPAGAALILRGLRENTVERLAEECLGDGLGVLGQTGQLGALL